MNSHFVSSNKKFNLMIKSFAKQNQDKKIFSFRSNTQEMPKNRKNNNSSINIINNNNNSNKSKTNRKNKNNNNEIPKQFTGVSNIINNHNFDSNKSDYIKNKNKIIYYKDILGKKDIEINELENKIKLYKDKLQKANHKKNNSNLNISINSLYLNKTKSSTYITERNNFKINSPSNSQPKIKTEIILNNNIYENKNNKKNINNKNKNEMKNEIKKRPKSNDYKNSKIIDYIFYYKKYNKKNLNNHEINIINNINKKNLKNEKNNYFYNHRRAKSTKIEQNKYQNKLMKSNINENVLLSLEQTKYLCDKIIEKLKYTLELVKLATTGK